MRVVRGLVTGDAGRWVVVCSIARDMADDVGDCSVWF